MQSNIESTQLAVESSMTPASDVTIVTSIVPSTPFEILGISESQQLGGDVHEGTTPSIGNIIKWSRIYVDLMSFDILFNEYIFFVDVGQNQGMFMTQTQSGYVTQLVEYRPSTNVWIHSME